jgi:hypothetical protein
MRKLFFSIICVFFVLPLQADEADSCVIFKADFLKHELQQYLVKLSSYTLKNGDTTELETLQSKVDVYVSDSSENQYIITWRFHEFSIDTNDRHIKDIVGLAKPVNLTYRTSRQGVINEFVSWEEVSSCLDDGMKVVLARFATLKDSSSKAEVKRIIAFRESFEAMMLRSVRNFHQVYGLGYNLNEEIDVPTDIYGLVSSEPVKGIIRKKLTKIDREHGVAILSTATFPDRESLKELYAKYYPGVSVPYSLSNQNFFGGVLTDMDTGWILDAFEQREGASGVFTSGEILEIRLF